MLDRLLEIGDKRGTTLLLCTMIASLALPLYAGASPLMSRKCVRMFPDGTCRTYDPVYTLKGVRCRANCVRFFADGTCRTRNRCVVAYDFHGFEKSVWRRFYSDGSGKSADLVYLIPGNRCVARCVRYFKNGTCRTRDRCDFDAESRCFQYHYCESFFKDGSCRSWNNKPRCPVR